MKLKLIIDTREQNPLCFRTSKLIEAVETKKLNVGDYSIEGYEDKIAIERKSAIDLFGSLGKGHARFKRELERAEGMDYFGILVDASFSAIKSKDFDNSHFSKMKGHVIIQICMTLKLKYNIDVVFCKDRTESASYVRELFKAYMKQQQNDNAK